MTILAFICGTAFGAGMVVAFPDAVDYLAEQVERARDWWASRK